MSLLDIFKRKKIKNRKAHIIGFQINENGIIGLLKENKLKEAKKEIGNYNLYLSNDILNYSCMHFDVKMVDFLISTNKFNPYDNFFKPLLIAIKEDKQDLVEYFLKDKKISQNLTEDWLEEVVDHMYLSTEDLMKVEKLKNKVNMKKKLKDF